MHRQFACFALEPVDTSIQVMAAQYPDDVQFVGLVEAATAAAEHQRDLGKRKRGEENAYIPVSSDLAFQEPPKSATLSNSASVLFREPSEKSKKYSRPPLGKVFTSLELAPDAFLKLQSAAKDYMLSEEYPERKDVVGHKKASGNNDTAKLRLYECVEEFLRQDGNGETFFGHSAPVSPDIPPRTFFWPEDQNRIIKLLMPLLRKMVTNERQRLYAAESRKGDSKKSNRGSAGPQDGEDAQMFNGDMVCSTSIIEYPGILTTRQADIDPTLQPEFGDTDIQQKPAIPDAAIPPLAAFPDTLNIYVNTVTYEDGDGRNLLPEFVLPSEKVATFEQFLSYLQYVDANGVLPEVKALLPQGLITIRDEQEWLSAKLTASSTVWMNQRLMIVVKC